MGSSHYVHEGNVYGFVASGSFGRRRGILTRYWAEIRDDRDGQYILACCKHEHREAETALPCLRRLFRIAVEVVQDEATA